ncbi:MAG: hypothetical protein V3T83_16600 [Acidobacteriota bacterium]
MAAEVLSAYSLPSQQVALPVPAWKPVPGGRLRQVKVRYGKGPVKARKNTRIELPVDAWVAFKDLRLEPAEVFRVAFLDSGNYLMAYEDIARGTVNNVIAPRGRAPWWRSELLRRTYSANASIAFGLDKAPRFRYPPPSNSADKTLYTAVTRRPITDN